MILPPLNYRAKNLAKSIIGYSTEVKAGEVVKLVGNLNSWEFMQELARLTIDRGAHPTIQLLNPELERYLLEKGTKEQYTHVFEHELSRAQEADVHIRVLAADDKNYWKDVDLKKISLRKQSRQDLFSIVNSPGKRTNTVILPTEIGARNNGLSLRDYEQLIYSATEVKWEVISDYLQNIKSILDDAEEVRIEVPDFTDLIFSLKGRGGCLDDGHINQPGGEVFYGPVEDSLEGFITFPYEQYQTGYRMKGIRLEYSKGKLKHYEARTGESYLKEIFKIEGTKMVGEIGFGGNYNVTKVSKEEALNEKIKGTMHLAPGRSSPQDLKNGGGLNQSSLHWDLVCELRMRYNQPGGKIYVNGNTVMENERWCFEK